MRLRERLEALEQGGSRYASHEDWLDAMERLERGEDVELPLPNPAAAEFLGGAK